MNLQKLAKRTWRSVSPGYRAKTKYLSELEFWRKELDHLKRWFMEASTDWWGVPPPPPEWKSKSSEIWAVNAVMTIHRVRPNYLEELRIEKNAFAGQRVLEVGCGPLAPILQFDDCIRHGLDPLLDQYIEAGWPLYDYDATFVNAKGEAMPYHEGYFDAVISVNALDHVDDFSKVASEIQRVLKVGGKIHVELEYHSPTVTEPQSLDDEVVLSSFPLCDMRKVIERGKRDKFQDVMSRFGLNPKRFDSFTNQDKFVTWHGERIM